MRLSSPAMRPFSRGALTDRAGICGGWRVREGSLVPESKALTGRSAGIEEDPAAEEGGLVEAAGVEPDPTRSTRRSMAQGYRRKTGYHFVTADGLAVSGRAYDLGYGVREGSIVPVFYGPGQSRDHMAAGACWLEADRAR